jgi:hypothetical protein
MSSGGILYAAIQAPEDEVPLEYVRDVAQKDTCRKFVRLMRNSANSSAPGERRSFQTGNVLINTLTGDDRTIFVAACKDDFNRGAVFECLAENKKAYSQNRSNRPGLERALKANVDRYSSGRDKIGEIKSVLDQTKITMLNNIDAVLERGEKIDTLTERSELLVTEAGNFESGARDLKWSMYKKRCLLFIVIFVILAIVIFLIVLFACKKDGLNFDKCSGSDSPAPAPAATTTAAPAPTTAKVLRM